MPYGEPGAYFCFLAEGELKVIKGSNLKGDASSRISAVYDAAPRQSFIAGLKDLPEVGEISYDPDARPFCDGRVHACVASAVARRISASVPSASTSLQHSRSRCASASASGGGGSGRTGSATMR